MIRINLLPPEVHAAAVRKQMSVLGGILGGLAVLGMLGFWGTRLVRANELEKQLEDANVELRKLQDIVDRVNQLEQTRNQLQARRDVIRQLVKGQLVYPKFFEDFMALIPSEVWLTNMNTNSDPSGAMNITATAQSLSNFAIADWITNLQKSPLCSNVNLGTISTQEVGEDMPPILSFSVSFRYFRSDS